jgi:hypothetical protein
MSDHFFSRWSRRKQGLDQHLDQREVTEAQPLTPGPGAGGVATPSTSGTSKLAASTAERVPAAAPKAGSSEAEPASPTEPALPTLDDVQGLTPSSDFQGFMRQGVPGEVRNAAMKKLFTDPHFNVMDGLDIYIGDYNTPDPLPAGMLEKMVGAQMLNLFPPQAAAELPSGQTEEAFVTAPPHPVQSPPQGEQQAQTAPLVAQSPPSAALVSRSSPSDSSFPPSSPLATPLAPSWAPPAHDNPDL